MKCLPSVQAIVPHHGESILHRILKVPLVKLHVFGQITVNLSQFRVPCYKSDVKLKLRFCPKPDENYKTIQRFIFKLLALKRVGISFFEGFMFLSCLLLNVVRHSVLPRGQTPKSGTNCILWI